MSGPATYSGRAVRLSFPGQQQQIPPATQQPMGGMPNDLGIPNPEYYQLDAAGIDQQIERGRQELEQFALDAYHNHGVRLWDAPDPTNPKDAEYRQLWNQALPVMFQIAERGRQGRENQKMAMEAYRDGKLMFDPSAMYPGQSPMTSQDFMQRSFQTDIPFIGEVNSRLAKAPQSQQEYEEMRIYYEQALQAIDQVVQANGMPPQAANYYKSQIRPPVGFDDRLTESQLKNDQARRAEIYSRMKRADQQARGGDFDLNNFPELLDLALITTEGESERAMMPLSAGYFVGKSLNGKGKLQFDNMYRESPGVYVLKFKGEDPGGLDKSLGATADMGTIRFGADDVWKAWQSVLTESQGRVLKEQLTQAGLFVDGKLPADRLLSFYRNNGQMPAGPPSTLDTPPSTPTTPTPATPSPEVAAAPALPVPPSGRQYSNIEQVLIFDDFKYIMKEIYGDQLTDEQITAIHKEMVKGRTGK